MTTYSQLKADLLTWATREDLASIVDSFIDLAEADINRLVRVQFMEADIDLSLTSANNYEEDLPTGWLKFKHLFVQGVTNPRMNYVPPEAFAIAKASPSDAFQSLSVNGETPYTIESRKLKIAPASSSTATYTIDTTYFKRITALSDAALTNDIISNHYDLYLSGALKWLWHYAEEAESLALWGSTFMSIVEAINNEERVNRIPSGAIRRSPSNRNIV